MMSPWLLEDVGKLVEGDAGLPGRVGGESCWEVIVEEGCEELLGLGW